MLEGGARDHGVQGFRPDRAVRLVDQHHIGAGRGEIDSWTRALSLR